MAKISAQAGATEPQIPAAQVINYPVQVNIKTLLEAGAHFGHQTDRWNPKMLPHIYGARNGVHIINLDSTLGLWNKARKYIADTASRGGNVLFVGTKLQAREIIAQEATRCGAFYVSTRWLGGALSNFQTIKNSIDRMRKLEELLTQASEENSKIKLNKKEKLSISRQLEKLQVSLGGIRLMKRVPDLLFVVDIVKESIAIAEANRLAIPVVALVDTNSDPDVVAFPVPSNDDASKTIRLFTAAAADAVLEGRKQYEDRMAREAPPDDGSSEDGSDEEKGVGAGEAAGGFSATESAQF